MNTELILVDAKKYGIEEIKAIQVTQAFTSELTELSVYQAKFNEISIKEITEDLVKEAKELRSKLAKSLW